MDYENIGVVRPPGPGEAYRTVQEPDSAASFDQLMKAKAFLSVVSPKTNTSMYDHLKLIIERVIRLKMEDAVDKVEEISLAIKNENFAQDTSFETVDEISRNVFTYIETYTNFYQKVTPINRDVNPFLNKPEDYKPKLVEVEDVDDSRSEASAISLAWSPTCLHDVSLCMFRFRQVGIGLGSEETFQLHVTLKTLLLQFQLEDVRFWGKIFGTKMNYYVAEAPYKDGIPFSDYGWTLLPDEDEENEEEMEVPKIPEQMQQPMDVDSLEGSTTSTTYTEGPSASEVSASAESQEPRKIPPMPELKPPKLEKLIQEKNGTGVNKYMYFVTNSLTSPWKCLPQLRPIHVIDARRLKKNFTGNLQKKIYGIEFQGVEAHYLRAQIARISASTTVVPNGRYRVKEIQLEPVPEENLDPNQSALEPPPATPQLIEPPPTTELSDPAAPEEKPKIDDNSDTEDNPDYEGCTTKVLFAQGLSGWAHKRQAIAPEGCCLRRNIVDEIAEKRRQQAEEQRKREEEERKKREEEEAAAAAAAAAKKKKKKGGGGKKGKPEPLPPPPPPPPPVEEEPARKPYELEEEPKTEEKPIPRLKPLSEDKGAGGVDPWSLREGSIFFGESGVVLARSNVWPGSFTYYDGKNFETTYIGYGQKYTARDYAPKLGETWQEEYPIGDDIIETVDEFIPDPVVEPPTDATDYDVPLKEGYVLESTQTGND